MSNYETKPNTGSLFKNDKKESDNHPDYKGSIDIDGVDHWLSSWIKTSAKGTKYMSLSAKKKDAVQARPAPKVSSGFDDFDGIPF